MLGRWIIVAALEESVRKHSYLSELSVSNYGAHTTMPTHEIFHKKD
jgi:hypothetical protein